MTLTYYKTVFSSLERKTFKGSCHLSFVWFLTVINSLKCLIFRCCKDSNIHFGGSKHAGSTSECTEVKHQHPAMLERKHRLSVSYMRHSVDPSKLTGLNQGTTSNTNYVLPHELISNAEYLHVSIWSWVFQELLITANWTGMTLLKLPTADSHLIAQP